MSGSPPEELKVAVLVGALVKVIHTSNLIDLCEIDFGRPLVFYTPDSFIWGSSSPGFPARPYQARVGCMNFSEVTFWIPASSLVPEILKNNSLDPTQRNDFESSLKFAFPPKTMSSDSSGEKSDIAAWKYSFSSEIYDNLYIYLYTNMITSFHGRFSSDKLREIPRWRHWIWRKKWHAVLKYVAPAAALGGSSYADPRSHVLLYSTSKVPDTISPS